MYSSWYLIIWCHCNCNRCGLYRHSPDGGGLLLVLEGSELCVEEEEGGVEGDVDVLGLALLEEARSQVEAEAGEDAADQEVGLGRVVLQVERAEPGGAEHLRGGDSAVS